MAIITRANAKIFLQIDSSDTSKDVLIDALIPVLTAKLCAYCNQTFLDDLGAESWPVGIVIDFIPLLKYYMTVQGKIESSESLPGGISVQYRDEAQIMLPFNKYRTMP